MPKLALPFLALAMAVAAQMYSSSSYHSPTISAATTMNLFLGPGNSGDGFVGSIINADQCGTTIAIVCDYGSFNNNVIVSGFCDEASTVVATYAPSLYLSSAQTTGSSNLLGQIETCHLDGTTRAVCSITYEDSFLHNRHKHTTYSTVSTYTGDQVVFWQIPITAGVSKLSALAPCTSTSTGAAAAAAATRISEVYKVLVVPALLAGVLV